jgi:hypothetical protein
LEEKGLLNDYFGECYVGVPPDIKVGDTAFVAPKIMTNTARMVKNES